MINIVGFVNDRRRDVLKPILAKLVIFTIMITLAVILYFITEPWVGIIIYTKEVIEFAMFIWYLRRGRRSE